MKLFTPILIGAFILVSSCDVVSTKIDDGAYIVNNRIDRTPLEGLYIELEYTKDEGSTYKVLASTYTDEYGYFEFDERRKDCFDCWDRTFVYSDSLYSDTLGGFEYAFQDDNLWGAHVLHVDTFVQEHRLWLVPRMTDLGDLEANGLYIHSTSYYANSTQWVNGQTIEAGQTYDGIEITMDMQLQHWLSFGTGELARGELRNNGASVGFGYFKAPDTVQTIEGDTLFLDFVLQD